MQQALHQAVERDPPDVFTTFGVKRVVNCCGIYTDLGGSILSPTVWQAVEQLNGHYVRMTDLLDAAGRLIADLVAAEAARVTPGASAAIALAVGATMTGMNGHNWEQLPDTTGMKNELLISSHHLDQYKYINPARMTGCKVIAAGDPAHFDLRGLMDQAGPATACVYVPAHLLDGFSGVDQLHQVCELAHARGLPVVVDAAYMSYPIDLLRSYAAAGADLTCFSAKYFFGPNSGGFVSGRRDLIAAVEGLDFTRFESGAFRKFGRPFKMSRYDVAGVALALQEWVGMDHAKRWADYRARVAALMAAVAGVAGVKAQMVQFTLDERILADAPPNAIAIDLPGGREAALKAVDLLAAGDPLIAAMAEGAQLVLAVDALQDGEAELIAPRLATAVRALAGD